MAVLDSVFLLGESREHPTHVGGLQLFRLPEGAEQVYVSEFYRELPAADQPIQFPTAAAGVGAACAGRGWHRDQACLTRQYAGVRASR